MPQTAPAAKPRAAVILAAGHGTRMKSATSKVLHAVGGRAMLDWSIDLARRGGAERIVVVAGAHSPAVGERARALGCEVALQDPPLGTGHAVNCAREAMLGFDGDLVVLYADTPLIQPQTVLSAFEALDGEASVVVLGFEPADPAEYGRLVESADGLDRIVEFKDASPAERAIGLCNSGVLAASARLMFELLAEVRNDNAKGEYYLTDVVGLARGRGLKARAVRCPEDEVLGVNSRIDLASAEAAFQGRARRDAMLSGVTLIAPETVFFSFDTAIGRDVIVEPNVVFGPGVVVEAGALIHAFSHLEGARVASGAAIGPYARLRPGADIGPGAKVGNFVEIKKARLGAGAKANHLSYLGDAEIGAGANVGAGTITCNYDGFAKHKTVIGEGAFIGSDTALVAPVTIGAGAYTGSGSVITKDVAPGALAVARGRQRDIEGWAEAFRAKHAAAKKTSVEKASE